MSSGARAPSAWLWALLSPLEWCGVEVRGVEWLCSGLSVRSDDGRVWVITLM